LNLLQRYRQFIKDNNLFSSKDKLLLAVSGGIDSVVLCHLCKEAGYDFSIAHCNFQLRGNDSDRDEKFVHGLAQKYGVEFFVKRFDTRAVARQQKKSIEETARHLRYEWFYSLLNTEKSDVQPAVHNYILTAHHADDNIETVMMNFFRGTGIRGLKGIEPKNGKIIRPLLFAWKKELEEFLQANNLSFVDDYTNKEIDYTRNYFRNELIPSVEKIFPVVKQNLSDTIQRLGEAAALYRQAVETQKKKLLQFAGNEVYIPVLKLKKVVPVNTIVYEIITEYGFSPHQVKDVVNLLDSETGKFVQSSTHRIIKSRNWIIISPNEADKAEIILIEEGHTSVQCPMFNIQLSFHPASSMRLPAANDAAFLDAKYIRFPLILRKWKQGDYFYPLGMRKKKKLSRFFIDNKLSKTEKEKVWVLEMDKKILWVIGYRIDDRFKVTDDTTRVLKIKLIRS